jgi:hypothetical protein
MNKRNKLNLQIFWLNAIKLDLKKRQIFTFNLGTNASDIHFCESLNIKTSALIKMI